MHTLKISAASSTSRVTVSGTRACSLVELTSDFRNSPGSVNRQTSSVVSQRTSSRTAEAADNANNAPTHTSTVGLSPGYVHTAGEATTIIRRELDSNSSLSHGRRRVLESALSLIGHFKDTSHSAVNASYDSDPEEEQTSSEIPSELFVMMLYGRFFLHNCSSSSSNIVSNT